MRIFKLLFAIVFIAGTIASCDKVEAPYKEEIEKPDTKQKVLLEDFTGHKCVYCPAAQVVAQDLVESYGEENLIVVAIHAGFLASPTPGSVFEYDFTTEAGTEYYNFFSIGNLPNGMVNRVNTDGDYVLPSGDWGTNVANELEIEPVLDIAINAEVNASKLSGDITLDFISNFDEESSLLIWVLEDSIIKPQTLPEIGTVEDYVHNHVLRGSVNENWGEVLPSSSYSEGASETISFSNFQLGEDWVAKNLSIVAFVYNNETKKVIQANKIHLHE